MLYNENRYRKTVCDHASCKECMSGWVSAQVSQANSSIICPHPDCKCMLYKDDVLRVATTEVAEA
jgi:hypothetical protein